MVNCKYIRQNNTQKRSTDYSPKKNFLRNTESTSSREKVFTAFSGYSKTRSCKFIRTNDSSSDFLTRIASVLIFVYISSLYVLSYSESLNKICLGLYALLTGVTVLNGLLNGIRIKLKLPDFFIFLFVIYMLISTFWVREETGVSQNLFTVSMLAILYYVFRFNFNRPEDFRIFFKTVIWGSALMCLYIFLYYGPATVFQTILSGGRIGNEISQENGIGYYCAVMSVFCLYFILYEKKFIYLALMCMSLPLQLACGSRKGILILAAGVFVVGFFKSDRKRFLYLLFIIIVFSSLLIICYRFKDDNPLCYRIIQLINSIFNEEQLTDKSAYDRKRMITYGLELLRDNPIFGYGPVQFEYFYSLLTGLRRPPHSTYIQVLVGYGLIGFTCIYGSYVYVIKRVLRMLKEKVKYSVLIISLLIMLLINDLGANMLVNKFFFVFLAMLVSYTDYYDYSLDEQYLEEEINLFEDKEPSSVKGVR